MHGFLSLGRCQSPIVCSAPASLGWEGRNLFSRHAKRKKNAPDRRKAIQEYYNALPIALMTVLTSSMLWS